MKKIFSVMTLLLFFGSAHYVSAAGSTSSVLTPCTGYSTTHFIPLDWGAAAGNVSVYTKDYGGFTNNEAVVVYFTTPSIPQTSTTIGGHIDGLQYIDLAVSARTSKLSAQPCDWSGA
ncbi:MAG: hypothetical protein KGJ31_03375, partial [Patescibacteria group bacterium]|nr:hypothetical protein [Patescibacteria group bacterium]